MGGSGWSCGWERVAGGSAGVRPGRQINSLEPGRPVADSASCEGSASCRRPPSLRGLLADVSLELPEIRGCGVEAGHDRERVDRGGDGKVGRHAEVDEIRAAGRPAKLGHERLG